MNKFKLFVLFSVFCLAIAMPLSYADDNETVVAADGQTENPIQQDGDILTSVSYYFDANAENDTGNGSIENPFKDLNADNIKDGSTLYLARGEYNLNKYCSVSNLTIIGSSASDTIVKYNRYQIALKSSSSLTLRNITLIDFKIECSGSLVAKNCIFKDNYASTLYQGSAINVKNKNACVNLNNCTFSNNYAQKGGAIHIEGGNLTVNNSTFTANHASNGGAIYISNGVLKIANSIFSYNYAGLCAGSIFCENDANVFINKTKFSNGYSINDVAGAIYLIDSSLTADALNIENCSSNFGGAMVCLKSTTTLNNFTAVNNSAAYDGGAVFAMYHEFSISNSTLTGNSAARGGALYVSAVDIFMISSNTFTNNTDDAIYSLGSDTYYDSILDEELNNTFIGNDVFEMEIPNCSSETETIVCSNSILHMTENYLSDTI